MATTFAAVSTRLESLDQAIAYGLKHGSTARECCIPSEIYEQSLKLLVDGWKGSKAEWVTAGETASRRIYRGELTHA
jgi:hypothetical protein